MIDAPKEVGIRWELHLHRDRDVKDASYLCLFIGLLYLTIICHKWVLEWTKRCHFFLVIIQFSLRHHHNPSLELVELFEITSCWHSLARRKIIIMKTSSASSLVDSCRAFSIIRKLKVEQVNEQNLQIESLNGRARWLNKIPNSKQTEKITVITKQMQNDWGFQFQTISKTH